MYYLLFRLTPYVRAAVFVGLALIARLLLEPLLQGHLPYSFFLVAVILTAWKTGTTATLTAAVLGFLAAAWCIVEPRQSLAISGADGWWGAAIYFVVSLAIVWFLKSTEDAESRALTKAVEAHRVQHELHHSEAIREFLASIVQSTQDAIISVTDQGRIATWNHAAEKRFGFSAREAIGQPLTLLVPAHHRQEEDLILDRINRGEPAEHWETVLNHKDGTGLRVSLTVSPVKDKTGKLIGASVVARNSAGAANPSYC
jgi:PAS domain S-box-containing protein